MVTPARFPLAALLALLAVASAAVAPAPAGAQIAAPRLVDEGEDEPHLDAAEPQGSRVDDAGGARATSAGEAPPLAPRAASPAASATPGEQPAAAAGAPAPSPAATPEPAPALARQIVPVQTSFGRLMELWAERRAAAREADPLRGEAAREALLAAQRELGIRNLVALSVAEVRASARALRSNLTADAVARAGTAVALAPDHPDAHLALARALLAHAPGSPGPALAAVRDALLAAAREPHARRAFLGDVLGAGFAAVFTAAAAVIVLLLLRRLRLFLHDFHHLPLLRGTASVQTGFLALVLLGTPLAFGLGPVAALAVAAAAVWLYLDAAERVVVTVALAALLAMPWGAGAAARLTAWSGSAAQRVHELEHGAVDDEEAAALLAAAQGGAAPPQLLAALGRHAKRRGDLELALRLYREAAAADPRAPELEVNRGNVLFMKGDLEGAKAAYLAAQDRAAGDLVVLGTAHYNLSKLYLRSSEIEKSAAARDRAESEAGEFLRAHGSDEDFSANRYLVDLPVPAAKIAVLAASDGSPAAVEAWVGARLRGALPPAVLPWGGAAFLALLWLAALAGRRLGVSRACHRCGRAACRRCDEGAGALCGQCVNVFTRRGVVDARDRLRKEAQVRRHGQFTRAATRVLAVVGAGAGQVFHGAAAVGALLLLGVLFLGFVIWFWRGIMPPPHPSSWVLLGKLVVAVPLGAGLWAYAVRDAFRRTRS